MSSSGSQTSARPPPKPKVLKPIDSSATLPGEDHQVGPGNPLAVFLLDRPQQAARLVEVHIVRPAIQRRKTLPAGRRAAAAVGDAIGAGAVPCHADEQRPVMAEIGRPPVLRVGHQRVQVVFQGLEIEQPERRGVVEILAHGIGQRRVLVQDLQVQLIRPPAAVRFRTANPMHHRALAAGCHIVSVHCSSPFLLRSLAWPANVDRKLRRRGRDHAQPALLVGV